MRRETSIDLVPAVVLFTDTNILIHYRRLAEIDWPSLAGSNSVRIVLAPVVLRELNEHKERGNTAKLRKRAQGVLEDLENIIGGNARAIIRPAVEVEILTSEPSIDFVKHHLSFQISDDQLLASIIQYSSENEGVDCRLITADVGLGLKAKSHGIGRLRLSLEYRLPEEKDATEKKIRTLEAENLALKSRIPSLSLSFEDGTSSAKFPLRAPSRDLALLIREKMAAIRRTNPKLTVSPPVVPPNEDLSPKSRTIRDYLDSDLFLQVPAAEIENYNKELDGFFLQYERYLRSVADYEDRLDRTIRLRVFVVNDGTCPAEGVVAEMHFPDGFEMFTEDKFPVEPEPPEPPEKPISQAERFQRGIAGLGAVTEAMYRTPLPQLGPVTFRNVSRPHIKSSNSFDVDFTVHKLKHGFREKAGDLLLVFAAVESAASFQIAYKIHAENLPAPASGKLHVIVVAKSPNASVDK